MRYKQKRISSRISDEVWEKLQKLKKDSGLTITAILSKLIMRYEIRPLKTGELLRIYKELNHIGNNINQIAHIANCERHLSADKINEAVELMDKVWDCVRSYGEEERL
jgi:predicted CopG family antitoxin